MSLHQGCKRVKDTGGKKRLKMKCNSETKARVMTMEGGERKDEEALPSTDKEKRERTK